MACTCAYGVWSACSASGASENICVTCITNPPTPGSRGHLCHRCHPPPLHLCGRHLSLPQSENADGPATIRLGTGLDQLRFQHSSTKQARKLYHKTFTTGPAQHDQTHGVLSPSSTTTTTMTTSISSPTTTTPAPTHSSTTVAPASTQGPGTIAGSSPTTLAPTSSSMTQLMASDFFFEIVETRDPDRTSLGCVQMAELYLLDDQGALLQPDAVQGISGARYGRQGRQSPTSLFDGSTSTKSCDLSVQDQMGSFYFSFSAPVKIDAYSWVTANDYSKRDPVS